MQEIGKKDASFALNQAKPMAAKIRLLGALAIEVDGRMVAVEARKNRGLIAALALAPGHVATRERLMALLWSDRSEDQARASLRQSLAVLRKDLNNGVSELLTIREEDVRLNPAAAEIDVLRFLKLAKARDDVSLREAASLYGGELLDGITIRDPAFEEWLSVEKQRLRRLIIEVLDWLVPLETGASATAVAHRLVDLDPLREASHRHLMQAYARQGESALALKQFEACKALLRQELGVDPSPETIDLKTRIAKGNLSRQETAKPSASPIHSRPAEKPTLAVLPFANLSGDPTQDYFSDGITEDIITELSRFRNMGVIARHSSFAYRGRSIGSGVISKELGAGYVLDGSVRRNGSRVRLTAQLSEAKTGNQVWAERYDREVTDIFDLQDELARNIAGTLAIELDDRELEQARGRKLDDEQAYEHFLRGKRQLWDQGEGMLEARGHLSKAIAIDPSLARAHAAMAVTYVHEAVQFPPRDMFERALTEAHDNARSALSLDPTECFGHMALGWVHLYRLDYERMKHHVDLAIKLNPNDADMLANATYMLAVFGAAEDAIQFGRAAMRLNPRHPDWYPSFLSMALFTARRYAEAWELRSRAPSTFYDSLFLGAATLAYLDRIEEAQTWGLRAVERLKSRLGERIMQENSCIQLLLDNNPYQRQEDREHFAQGMRMAGIPG